MQADIHLQMWGLWILCSVQKWASRTNKCLLFRPFFSYSRAPQVQCQVAGAQSCSWYFIGILQLRETVALGTMLQLLPLGRLEFILLNCFPRNTNLNSQVCCTFLWLLFWQKMGHLNPPEAAVWAGVARESVLGVWSSQTTLWGCFWGEHWSFGELERCLCLFKPMKAICVQGLHAWFGLLLY